VEVSESLGKLYLAAVADAPDPYSVSFISDVREALDAGEPEKIEAPLNGLYASIPYQLHEKSEAYYHSIFLATMQFLGLRVLGEVSVAKGRADGVLDRPNGMSYVVEFKYKKAEEGASEADTIALLEEGVAEARAQIEEKRYADRYSGSGRTVFKLAVCVAGRGAVRVRTA
jgi:hypothetical protein